MSYDINIKFAKTRQNVMLPKPHKFAGGTYAIGGTNQAWLNVTYNYAPFFYELFGERGIRTIYGKTIKEADPILTEAIAKLGDEAPDEDYWKATKGNARQALLGLKALGELAMKAFPRSEMIWTGD